MCEKCRLSRYISRNEHHVRKKDGGGDGSHPPREKWDGAIVIAEPDEKAKAPRPVAAAAVETSLEKRMVDAQREALSAVFPEKKKAVILFYGPLDEGDMKNCLEAIKGALSPEGDLRIDVVGLAEMKDRAKWVDKDERFVFHPKVDGSYHGTDHEGAQNDG